MTAKTNRPDWWKPARPAGLTLAEAFAWHHPGEPPDSDECWEWQDTEAVPAPGGYGHFKYRGKTRRAPRVAYELFVGPIPEGLDILHSCDNPPCVNPRHLRPGTDLDNARDRESRGRGRKPKSPGQKDR